MTTPTLNVRVAGKDTVHARSAHCRTLVGTERARLEQTTDPITCKFCLATQLNGQQLNGSPSHGSGPDEHDDDVAAATLRAAAVNAVAVVPRRRRAITEPPPSPALRFSDLLERQALDMLRMAWAMRERGM